MDSCFWRDKKRIASDSDIDCRQQGGDMYSPSSKSRYLVRQGTAWYGPDSSGSRHRSAKRHRFRSNTLARVSRAPFHSPLPAAYVKSQGKCRGTALGYKMVMPMTTPCLFLLVSRFFLQYNVFNSHRYLRCREGRTAQFVTTENSMMAPSVSPFRIWMRRCWRDGDNI